MKRASVNKLNLGLTYVNTTAGFSRAIIELRENKGRFFPAKNTIFAKIDRYQMIFDKKYDSEFSRKTKMNVSQDHFIAKFL